MLAAAFVADAVSDIVARLVGREALWGVDPGQLSPCARFVTAHRAPSFLEALAVQCAKHGTGPDDLGGDFELVADTFRRFADDKIRPVAEHVHRTNADVPEDIISGLAEIGGFGLSVPEEYDGFATGGESDYIGMVVATEESSRARSASAVRLRRPPGNPHLGRSSPVAPKNRSRPGCRASRSGEAHGRHHGDRARLRLRRCRGRQGRGNPTDGGWLVNEEDLGHVVGRADVLMLLARTDPDKSKSHPRSFRDDRREAARRGSLVRVRRRWSRGKMEGRAIDTIGVAGMHLRGGIRQLVRPGREPHRRRSRSRSRLLLPDGGLRERTACRPPARGGRPHAGRVRSRDLVRAGPQGVRQPGLRLPTVEGEARAHGVPDPGRTPVLLRRRPQDGRR